ncbi:MAG: nucleotide sugar dehydrogenase [Thermoplasmata archaeon]|nr:MAG: nucleotide sugar dehydrogenase [Thermoplasmata archaeon]
MKISVFGLGYVGSVLLGCLPDFGHELIGDDIKSEKVELINSGQSQVYEKDLIERIKKQSESNKISATTDDHKAIEETELCLICVGTPGNLDGSINLDHVETVTASIGAALKSKSDYFVVGYRSTMLPGSIENFLIPVLEESSDKKLNKDFGVCMNPEFLREGQAVYDFFNPARTVIGESDPKAGEKMELVYKGLDAPVVHVPINHAEMIKYIDNSYHGLKIAFANEIGAICNRIGMDSSEVMKLFFMDDKLNISAHYLKPGFAFGGSCIPKDLNAIIHFAKQLDMDPRLLEGVLSSNSRHIERALELIQQLGKTNVGILGLSFKEDTDDVRESPVVKLVNRIFEKSYLRLFDKQIFISIWDPHVNRSELGQVLPHFIPMLKDSMEDVVKGSDIVVIGNANSEMKELNKYIKDDQIVLDLVKFFKKDELQNCEYVTIS